MEKLTDIQDEIVKTVNGPVLVTAGAGSGKTRVLTSRVAYLVKELGVPQKNILTITFTNKAAGEMKERISSMLDGCCNVWMGTFHSFCARTLRKNISYLPPYNTNFSIYSESDKERVIKELLAENGYKEDAKKEMQEVLEFHISNYKNFGNNLQNYENELCTLKNAKEVIDLIKKYNSKLETNNALDFDDLLIKTLLLFETIPSILERYQDLFKYIMVDEFQDTNVVQYSIVKLLASKHKNIMVVGDEDQCIYTWRGASIENILNFKSDFPNVKIFKLEENFRSSKNIVERANILINNNNSRLPKTLFSSKTNGVIEGIPCFNDRHEAQRVAETIYNLVNTHGYNYGDFAILMRINALSRLFEEQLLGYNMPHVVYGGFKFYERQEVKNIISYLRILANPADDGSLVRIINFPKRGIGDATVDNLKREAFMKNTTLLNIVLNSELPKIKPFAELIKELQTDLAMQDFFSFFDTMLKKLNISMYYKATKKDEDLSRLENVYSLLSAVEDYVKENPSATIHSYLETVTLLTDLDTNDNSEAITLATIHSAKGLEFKTVFVVGCEEGIFPSFRKQNSISEMEEERRLMYVAVTRAKERLYISSCQSRFLHGKVSDMLTSRFIKEMGLIKEKQYEKFNDFDIPKSSTFIAKESKEQVFVKQPVIDIPVNTMVMHPKFGKGIVTEIIIGGFVKVQFDGIGSKTLSLAYAPLEVIK